MSHTVSRSYNFIIDGNGGSELDLISNDNNNNHIDILSSNENSVSTNGIEKIDTTISYDNNTNHETTVIKNDMYSLINDLHDEIKLAKKILVKI